MKCTNCQYENDPSARFCSQCGMPLNGAQAVPDAAQTTRRSEARASAQTERSPYARPLPASGTPDAPHTAARQTA
ncbi:MAG: zinc ribbon domain-containing protein, partial [Candidatus Fimadaptatus sp.]|nr:zinc ribbon domain-containing protein [Candidatus Fimadaptatus sp.]